MKEYWDHRYSHEDYAYGTKPNEFFKTQIDKLTPGKILLPAEGEGRNAVYAALKGWEVYAFDFSKEGKKKAQKLADRAGVKIYYSTSTIEDIEYSDHFFDVIAFVFVHLPENERRMFHQKMQKYLKNEGLIILEGFSKSQYHRTSGGPKNIGVLFSTYELRKDFSFIKKARIREVVVILNEGCYHQGMASVIRFTGKRHHAKQSVIEEIHQEFI